MSKLRAIGVTAIALALAACGFIRSLDGFDDAFGQDASTPTEASIDVDVKEAGPADAGISCDPPEVMYDGGARVITGPYLYGMAQDDAHLYVVGGAYGGDAGAVGNDAGFALRVDKAPPFASTVVASELDFPTAIAKTSTGIYFTARNEIYRLDPSGGTPFLLQTLPSGGANAITDMTGDDAGLWFTTGLGTTLARLNFIPGTDITSMVSTYYPGAFRIRTDDDSVFVSRRAGDAGPGLARFDRDAALVDGGPPSCALDPDNAVDLATDGTRILWTGLDNTFHVANASACGAPIDTVEVGLPVAVAIRSDLLFVRYAGSLALYADSGASKVCTFSLATTEESPLGFRATTTAFFDGDFVYFQTPQRVYRMRVKR